MASQSLQQKRPFSRETAIQEVSQGHELMTQLRSHLQLLTRGDDRSELAGDLSKGVLQALTTALSILKSNKTPTVVGLPACYSTQENEGTDKKAKLSADGDKDQNNQRGQKRRRHLNSWTKVTPAPYDDGHQWRKYGQKKIHNAEHPRSYYRCTYRDDQGCHATKQVQQENCDGSLMFLVIYTNQHSCSTTMLSTPQLIVASSPRESSFFIFESKESMLAVTSVINHEQLQLSSITPPKGETGRGMFRSQSNNSNLVMNSTSSDWTKLGPMEMMDEVMTTGSEDILLSPCRFLSSHESEFEEVDNVLSTFVQYGLC